MISGEDLERDRLQTHLTELMRAACADPGAGAQLEALPRGQEGGIEVLSLGKEHPIARISESLPLDEAETAVVHEAGHWLEGHEEFLSDPWRAYFEARTYDEAHGTRRHGPFEYAADGRAMTLLEDGTLAGVLQTDPARIAELLVEDARRYPPVDPALVERARHIA